MYDLTNYVGIEQIIENKKNAIIFYIKILHKMISNWKNN